MTKKLSLCHILLELQGLNPAYLCDIGVTTLAAATTPKCKSTAAALSPARSKLCLALLAVGVTYIPELLSLSLIHI